MTVEERGLLLPPDFFFFFKLRTAKYNVVMSAGLILPESEK